jgi:hypothetical protein
MRWSRPASPPSGFTPAFGERRLLCRQATTDGQEMNRRVEILVGAPRFAAQRH